MPKVKLRAENAAISDWPDAFVGGAVCLDFINTLDDRPSVEPKELLQSYSDLARFGKQAGILTARQFDHLCVRVARAPGEAEKVRRRAIHLREAMHAVFSALINRRTVPQEPIIGRR